MVTGRLPGVVLLLNLVLPLAWSVSVDICACRYRFVEQPSNAIMCNPYPTDRFITRCIVDFSTNEGLPLSLSWFSRANSVSAPVLLRGGFTTLNGARSVESTLTVALPAATPSDYEGYRYFCRVSFFNGTTLKDSQEFYLFPQTVVTSVLDYPTCDEGSAQSTQFEECIDPNYPTVPPPIPTTTAPETTSSPADTTTTTTTQSPTTPPPTTPPTTTPPPTTPPPTTSPPTTPPPSTPEPIAPTTKPPPSPPPPTTSTPEDVSASNNALTFDEQVLLYSAIAAAVVLVVIVVILLLCLCMWNRVCRQSKYCMCNSYY